MAGAGSADPRLAARLKQTDEGAVYEAGGDVGCQACHGMNGTGGAQFNAPDIRGADETRVRAALAGVAVMSRIMLNDVEIAAVVAHLQALNKQP